MKNGSSNQIPNKSKNHLLIALIALGAVFILIICGVVALLLIGSDDVDQLGQSNTSTYSANMTNGYVSVVEYGAIPSDGKDDTDAFLRAAASGRGIYVPAGEYHISKTIEIKGKDIIGEGLGLTKIKGTSSDALFRLSGNGRLAEMSLGYSDGNAARGEKTAVRVVAGESSGLAPSLKNVEFCQIGTAVFVESGTTGIRLEDLTIEKFGYAGVVFDAKGHRGAILRSIWVRNALAGASYGIELQGDEGTLLEQITVEESKLKQGVYFDGSVGFSVKTAQFLKVNTTAMLGGKKAAGRIGSVYTQGSAGDIVGFFEPVSGEIKPEYTVVR